MRSSTLLHLGVATVVAAVLASCAASSRLTSSWADPAASGRTYKKMVVVGVTPQSAMRRMYEDAFASQLKQRGIDTVTRVHHCRRVDFRRGERLSKDDHIVEWRRPGRIRSIDWQSLKLLPERLTIRETRVRIQQSGFRCRSMIVVSTLLDAEAVTASDLAELYRARWNAELDLRSLKQTMQMDILRCKTPELVRKEIWTHVLAYNLIRTIIAQAADKHRLEPRTVSFKGAVQILEAFQPLIATQGDCSSTRRQRLYEQLLDAVATHRVGDRPDRFEPRQRKRRQKKYDRMMKPRILLKRQILKGVR